MVQEVYGFRPSIPRDVDFVLYSNEDIGFIATLTAGTNDVFAFALPYPATLDLFDETIMVHALEMGMQQFHGMIGSTGGAALVAHLAMLDREFGASWFGNLSDADDEALKAQFAGPIVFGTRGINITAVASVEGTYRPTDQTTDAIYFPPVPLDLVTPLFIQFTGQNRVVTLATNATAEADYTDFESVYVRVWFTRRGLTSEERQGRNMSIRFQRLDS